MEEELELIHRFIKKECSSEEHELFEKRLKEEPELSALYHQEKALIQGIGLAERERLKQMLTQSKKKKSYLPWYASIAATFLILTGYFIFFAEPDYQVLFDSHYEPYGVYEFGQERGDVDSITLEIQAFDLYKNGNYSGALTMLNKLYQHTPSEGITFYQAICQMEIQDFESAKSKLESISPTSDYHQIAKWYMALIYLKEENTADAKTLLNQIASQNGGLSVQAKELLEKL